MASTIAYPSPTFGGLPPVAKPPSIFDVYAGSLKQTGQDYDSLMGNYRDLLGTSKANASSPLTFNPNTSNIQFNQQTAPINSSNISPNTINPSILNYAQSGDTTNALAIQNELAKTGGYSDAGIADLRARGISPIRSVYSSAQNALNRQKSLQGGYSPGYQAATAKMARELSDQIAGQVTNVNAGIAQSVASNKLQAAPALAATANEESNRAASILKANQDAMNQANQFNASSQQNTQQANARIAQENADRISGTNQANANNSIEVQRANASIAAENAARQLQTQQVNAAIKSGNQAQLLEIMKSMQSLYGTTPALANTFGNQALAANQQNIGVAQNNANRPNPQAPLVGSIPNFPIAGR